MEVTSQASQYGTRPGDESEAEQAQLITSVTVLTDHGEMSWEDWQRGANAFETRPLTRAEIDVQINRLSVALCSTRAERDAWASKCGEATERALRAERERDEIQEKLSERTDAALTAFERLASAEQRLAERDASLRRATGR